MRPSLEAIASYKQRLDEQDKQIQGLQAQAKRQRETNAQLARGLQTLAEMAGVEGTVASAMLRRTADVQNPAQPVPEPPAGPPTQTTPQVEAPEAMANVQEPGLVPGSTNDVAADATTTVYTPGMDVPRPPFQNLQDVTVPVDGTQNPRPLSETRTLTDVRAGDPMNPQTAFPLRGEFQQQQRTSAKTAAADASRRTMASLRLAELRMEARTASGDSRYGVAGEIEKSAMTTEAIEQEITTLQSVKTASQQHREKANLVPRSAAKKPTPSMQGAGTSHTASGDSAQDATDIFL